MATAQGGLHYSQGLLTAGAFVVCMALGIAVLAQFRILFTRLKSRSSDTKGLPQMTSGARSGHRVAATLTGYARGEPEAVVQMQRLTQKLCLVAFIVGVALGGLAFLV